METNKYNSYDEVDINLEKAYAILSQYRDNAYIDRNELGEIELKMITANHSHNSLLFVAGLDYLAAAMNGLEKLLKDN